MKMVTAKLRCWISDARGAAGGPQDRPVAAAELGSRVAGERSAGARDALSLDACLLSDQGRIRWMDGWCSWLGSEP